MDNLVIMMFRKNFARISLEYESLFLVVCVYVVKVRLWPTYPALDAFRHGLQLAVPSGVTIPRQPHNTVPIYMARLPT
jgi:hypothetical protein